jgi:hypothetical protein
MREARISMLDARSAKLEVGLHVACSPFRKIPAKGIPLGNTQIPNPKIQILNNRLISSLLHRFIASVP